MTEVIDMTVIGPPIAHSIRERLKQRLALYGPGETLSDTESLKSSHAIDEFASDIAVEFLGDYRCNIFIEGRRTRYDPYAPTSFYIDPVDGGTNWDRCVGDPAFVIAACGRPAARTLADLESAYVEGLASGDRYWAESGEAIYYCARVGRTATIGPRPAVPLARATGYLRFGYSGAREQLKASISLMLESRDLRAFDNAGMEVCELARGAADYIVDARGLSDGFNLISYPILRAAGGVLLDLDGGSLEDQPFDPASHYNYIAVSSAELGRDVVTRIRASREGKIDRSGSHR